MTLNHSKTWPVGTLAVVQLRVDPNGRTYSTVTDQEIPLAAVPTSQKSAATRDNQLKHSVTLYENFSLTDRCDRFANDIQEDTKRDDEGIVLPLSKEHLELFTKMSSAPPMKTTIRTDTISTLLDPTEYECERFEEKGSINIKFSAVFQFNNLCYLLFPHFTFSVERKNYKINLESYCFAYGIPAAHFERVIFGVLNFTTVTCAFRLFRFN